MNFKRLHLIVLLAASVGGCAYAVAAWSVTGLAYGAEQIDKNGAFRDYECSVDELWPIVLDELKKIGVEKTMDDVTYDKDGVGHLKEGDGHLSVLEHPKYKQYSRVYVKVGTFATDEKFNRTKAFLDAISDRLDQ